MTTYVIDAKSTTSSTPQTIESIVKSSDCFDIIAFALSNVLLDSTSFARDSANKASTSAFDNTGKDDCADDESCADNGKHSDKHRTNTTQSVKDLRHIDTA
jgi:hypothetical protein